jgi:hypothetical protein
VRRERREAARAAREPEAALCVDAMGAEAKGLVGPVNEGAARQGLRGHVDRAGVYAVDWQVYLLTNASESFLGAGAQCGGDWGIGGPDSGVEGKKGSARAPSPAD